MLLAVIDRKWREHLYEMDYLQDGVGLRAYAQRDPLVEYQREGFDMFAQMLDGIKEEAVGFLFNLEVQVERAAPAPATAGVPLPDGESRVEVRAKGLGQRQQPQRAAVLRADDRRRGRRGRAAGAAAGSGARHRRRPSGSRPRRPGRKPAPAPQRASRSARRGAGLPQRALPLRLRQEVQALPRRHPRRRVTATSPTHSRPHRFQVRPAFPCISLRRPAVVARRKLPRGNEGPCSPPPTPQRLRRRTPPARAPVAPPRRPPRARHAPRRPAAAAPPARAARAAPPAPAPAAPPSLDPRVFTVFAAFRCRVAAISPKACGSSRLW